MKVWHPKVLQLCQICKEYLGRKHNLVIEYEYFYDYFFDTNYYYICYYCYKTMENDFDDIYMNYIERFHYNKGDEDNPDYHDYCKRYIGKSFIKEEYIKVLTRYIKNNNGLIVNNDGKHIPDSDLVKDRLMKANEFIKNRQILIDNINYYTKYNNNIAIFKLLQFDENSYVKYLPKDIINHILTF